MEHPPLCGICGHQHVRREKEDGIQLECHAKQLPGKTLPDPCRRSLNLADSLPKTSLPSVSNSKLEPSSPYSYQLRSTVLVYQEKQNSTSIANKKEW